MEINAAMRSLGALSQATRLEAFRLLVRAGPDGLPAGDIARTLKVPANTLSAHLSLLTQAGLLQSRRRGRSVIYGADIAHMHALIDFLLEDCCQGHPAVCGPRAVNCLPNAGITSVRENPATAPGTDLPLNVLFLCTANSARSILAEALLNHLGGGRFRAYSAGSFPRGDVNPLALRVLADAGVPGQGLRSKSWDEFATADAPHMDLIVTVCDSAAGETCPLWPGHPATVHWGIADPAAKQGGEAARMQAFRRALAELQARITRLTALPDADLQPSALAVAARRIHGDTESTT